MSSTSETEQIREAMHSSGFHSEASLAAIVEANNFLRSKGQPPLIDLTFLKNLATLRANPDKFDTSLEPAPEGYEWLIDVTGKNPKKLVPIEDDREVLEEPEPEEDHEWESK